MCQRKGFSSLVTIVAVLIIVQAAAEAAVVMDDFSAPDPMSAVAINLLDPDPTLVQTAGLSLAAVGGERDILLDVMGVSGLASFSGTVGGGSFVFNSSVPGVAVTIQYDGIDADIVGPPAALVNSEGLGGADLTTLGSAFFLDFATIEGGQGQATDIEIEVHGGGAAAIFVGQIPDSAGPLMFLAPFGGFSNQGALQQATSIEVRINPYGASDVDFSLNAVGIPEPATLSLLGLGLLAMLRRRKRR